MASEASTKKRKASNPSAAPDNKKPKKAKKPAELVSSVQNIASSVGNTIASASSTAAEGIGGSKSKKSKGKNDAQTTEVSKKRSAESMAADVIDEKSEVEEASVAALNKKSKKQKKAKASDDTGVVANAAETLANASTQAVDAINEKISKPKKLKKPKKAKAEDDNVNGAPKVSKASKIKDTKTGESVSSTSFPTEELVAVKESTTEKKNKKNSLREKELVESTEKSYEVEDQEVRLQTLDQLIADRGLPSDVTLSKPASRKSKSKRGKTIEILSTAESGPSTKMPKSKKTKVIDPNTPDAQNLTELAQAVTASQDDHGRLSGSESEGDGEEDDQTAALLRGFESDNEEEASGAEGYTPFKPIPLLDQATTTQVQKINSSKNADMQGPGVVYLGRIPHGFYEREMRAYFTQFGRITKLRLSRNRATGASKHYAFIEFASADVALIVAKTMDSYLLFNHILKCRVVPPEQVHERLFVGANKKFKQIPWNKIEGRKLEQGKTREKWDGKVARENRKRSKKSEALREIGYEYEAPKLKTTQAIPIRDTAAADTAATAAIAADTAASADIAATATTVETRKTPEDPAPKAIENGEVDKAEEQDDGKKKRKRKSKTTGKGRGEGEEKQAAVAAEVDGSGNSNA